MRQLEAPKRYSPIDLNSADLDVIVSVVFLTEFVNTKLNW